MKKGILIILVFIAASGFAQTTEGLFYPHYQLKQINEMEINLFLKNYFHDLDNNDIQLSLSSQHKTKVSRHFTFDIEYKQILLLNSTINVNTDNLGNIVSIKREGIDASTLSNFNPQDDIFIWSQLNKVDYINHYWGPGTVINSQEFKIQYDEQKVSIVLEVNAWNKTSDKTLVLDIDGNKVAEYDNARHINIDTLVNVKVFNPDPLTALSLVYGGIHIDNNDANDTWFGPAYFSTTVQATFDNSNNTFYLENQYAKIDDIEAPNTLAATSLTPDFLFDRSQSGFEDANAFYHITNFHNYISSLGYDTLMDIQLIVDTHGQFGADNSVFNRNGGNANVIYGPGGVDDAEDADVIIHEYCHGVSWSANNNSTMSFERSGLDEGLADYFATSYTRAIKPYNWQNVFNWDGPVWGGRTAATTNNYPSTSASFYAVGEIWNCAMSGIWTDLGNIVTDKLMLESLHFFTNNTTLPEAASYVLQSDTLLFGGIHTNVLCNHFQAKHIFDANCKPVGIADIVENNKIQLVNSKGFAENAGDAKINFPTATSGMYTLYDFTGKIIRRANFIHVNHIAISPTNLMSGMYILSLKIDEAEQVFKLNKF